MKNIELIDDNKIFVLSGESSQLEDYECFYDLSLGVNKLSNGDELLKIDDAELKRRWLFFYRPYNYPNKIAPKQKKEIKKQQVEIEQNNISIRENKKIFRLSLLLVALASFFIYKLNLDKNLYYFVFGIFIIFDSKLIITNWLFDRRNKLKKEVIYILYEEIEYLNKQQHKYLKEVDSKKIIKSFWQDMKELESHFVDMIFKKNISSLELGDFYKDKEFELIDVDLTFPIIPSWALLQESRQKVDNSDLRRKTGIHLAFDKIGNKVVSWRIDTNKNPFFRVWYIQFLLFSDKNLVLVSIFYDFVMKKIYSEHIELYQYNHITNYSYSNEDITYMEEDIVINKIDLPKKLKDKIFNNETKIISLESASGSNYRCVLPNRDIVDKFGKWIEYKKKEEDIEKQFEDLDNEIDNEIPNPYESELFENSDNIDSLTQSLAWKAFEELKRKVEESANLTRV